MSKLSDKYNKRKHLKNFVKTKLKKLLDVQVHRENRVTSSALLFIFKYMVPFNNDANLKIKQLILLESNVIHTLSDLI